MNQEYVDRPHSMWLCAYWYSKRKGIVKGKQDTFTCGVGWKDN